MLWLKLERSHFFPIRCEHDFLFSFWYCAAATALERHGCASVQVFLVKWMVCRTQLSLPNGIKQFIWNKISLINTIIEHVLSVGS